jgi:aspartyl-tRNA synthetase
MEMSFVTQEDIFKVVEEVLESTFDKFATKQFDKPPFRRIPYRESMLKYGCDKPDLRNPLEIQDVSSIFTNSGFKVFDQTVVQGGVVRAIPVKGCASQPRAFFDRMVEFAQSVGSQGLAYLVWNDNAVKGPIAKFLDESKMAQLKAELKMDNGDVAFFVCNDVKRANKIAGEIRTKLGTDLNLVEKDIYRFCWITDFPMYEWNEEHKRIDFSHNPFSMPQGSMDALVNKDPLDILAYQYDIVCNGIELSSGAIRNHLPEVMYKAFEIAGYDKSVVDEKFAGMINAFRFGAPPHGGIAPGVDRMVMILADEPNIREVVAFPMNQKAQDLMMKAPAEVMDHQLKELHLKTVKFN